MALSTLQPTSIVATAAGLTTATTTYTAGDMLGSELTLTSAAAATGGRGVITGIHIQDSAVVVTNAGLDIRLFNAASTPAADNAANSWSDANSRLQVVAYQTPKLVASALNASIYVGNLWLPFTTSGSANLFLNVITLGTLAGSGFFAAATDLQYTFEILQWV